MIDVAHAKTDKDIKTLERKIHSVFSQAEKEIEAKTKSFNERFGVKYNIHLQELKDEKITESQFRSWANGQVFQSRQWEAKRDQMIKIMHNANETATQIINATTPNVFAYNANFLSYSIEHDAATSFGFGLFDNATVVRLIKDDPQLLPKWKVDEKKDYIWNEKKVNNAVTQGIIQGEPLDAITKRLSKGLAAQNENTMRTFARTAMTGAQNAGRLESIKQGERLGLQVYKEWMATLDSHTRDSHADIDGESVPADSKFSNGLSYPGEAGGDPAEVYNCRCTMVADVKKYPSSYKRYDNVSRTTIKNMTYKEWYDAKHSRRHKSAEEFMWDGNYKGTPNRNYGKADTSDALQEILSGKENSLSRYLDKDGNLTPERTALHKQIIDNYLSGKVPEEGTATMVMMGGGPASGKSSVIKSGLYQLPDKNRTITIDPDDIKRYLPNYLELSKVDSTAASFYHEESSMLAKQLAHTCFSGNYNVVYDGTGDGSVKSVMKKLDGAKEQGYKVNGMYVTVNTKEALIRNKSRYDHAVAMGESPRLVPDEYVIDCHKKVTQISMEVSDKFDSISLYDNNGGSGDIKLIAVGGDGVKLTAVKGEEKAFKDFLAKGE